MRIIAGTLKGRVIPFNNRKFGDAETTQQKLKEALFSILGDSLGGSRFLDLYACSGQIGFEAASRGSSLVVMNEPDFERHAFIRTMTGELGIGEIVRLYRLRDVRCVEELKRTGISFDIVFLDPPYEKKGDGEDRYSGLLDLIGGSALLAAGARVAVQHFGRNRLPETVAGLVMEDLRHYGSTNLAIYARPV
jgi:16S rRNA (guanine966-N2)-methyltransferase